MCAVTVAVSLSATFPARPTFAQSPAALPSMLRAARLDAGAREPRRDRAPAREHAAAARELGHRLRSARAHQHALRRAERHPARRVRHERDADQRERLHAGGGEVLPLHRLGALPEERDQVRIAGERVELLLVVREVDPALPSPVGRILPAPPLDDRVLVLQVGREAVDRPLDRPDRRLERLERAVEPRRGSRDDPGPGPVAPARGAIARRAPGMLVPAEPVVLVLAHSTELSRPVLRAVASRGCRDESARRAHPSR